MAAPAWKKPVDQFRSPLIYLPFAALIASLLPRLIAVRAHSSGRRPLRVQQFLV